MRDWFDAHKPAASGRGHLLLASMMWTIVGTLLLAFGVRWVVQANIPFGPLMLAGALALGVVKSRVVLDRAAGRIIDRIRARGDGKCLGGFLSLPTWGIVAVMVVVGRLMRGGTLPLNIVGFVYAAIGTALLLAARHTWRAWYREPGREDH